MKTVLIVDDEPAIVRVVRDYLERAGFHVISAGDGGEALRASVSITRTWSSSI